MPSLPDQIQQRPGHPPLEVQDNYVRIDGLQVWMTTDTNGALGITFRSSLGASDYEVSNSIVRGNGSGIEDIRVGLEIFSAGSGVLKANNNLFYDWIGSGLTFVAGISPDDPDFTVYLYNNTVVDCEDGINAIQGTVVAKNNLVYNNTDNYVGVFDAASTNNLSGPGPDTEIPLTNAQDGVSVTFVNPGTDDWHLDPSDTGARDFGTNLAGDPDLAFVDDIDGELRPAPWDIGADEVVAGTGQVHYRWRNDDGGEIGATWAEPEDTKLIGLAKNDPRRLRFQVANNSGVGTGPVAYQLQVAETVNCDVGVYTPVPTVVTDHWRIIDSGFLTDGTATSNVAPGLTDEALTFIDGEVKDLSNTTGTIALADNEFTEIEFSLEATANATDGSDYCFRLFDTVAPGPLPSYVVYAEVRILASAASLTLAEHGAGQVPDQFLNSTPVMSELFAFNLSRLGGVTVDNIRVQFSTGTGVVDSDVTNATLYRDANNDGIVNGGDIAIATGVNGSGGMLAFNGLGEDPGALDTNYLVEATVSNLMLGDTTTLSLGLADIDVVEGGVTESGAVSNAVHTQDNSSCPQTFNYLNNPINVTPATAGSWQDVDVSLYIPIGATGVIVQWVGELATDWDYGIRMNGSSDTFGLRKAYGDAQGFLMTGVDGTESSRSTRNPPPSRPISSGTRWEV